MSYPVTNNLPPVHPGKILSNELDALEMTPRDFAAHIGVSTVTLTDILRGKSPLHATMALRLSRVFRTTAEYWMNLQQIYDLKTARINASTMLDDIQPLVPPAPSSEDVPVDAKPTS